MWVLVEENRYRVNKGQHSMEDGIAWFDKQHRHEGRFCDYCRAKWVLNESYAAIKGVDHDGAFVKYEVHWTEIRTA